MVIGINYTDSGERTIARVWLDTNCAKDMIETTARTFASIYDEVYVIGIDKPLDKLFDIKAVVTEGCRIV